MEFSEAFKTSKQHLGEDLMMCCGKKGFIPFFLHLWHPGFLVSFFYRCARFFYWIGWTSLAKITTAFGRFITSCDVHYRAELDGGIQFPHGNGVVIGEGVKIGKGCYIFHHATLGAREGQSGAPCLEEGVNVYPGVVIAGPVKIGEYSRIGPCVYLTDSVPSHTRVKPPEPIVKQSHG